MNKEKRTVYFVSESTGITAETLGSSLLSQFPHVDFDRVHMPFINTVERAKELVVEFADVSEIQGHKPLVLATMPDKAIHAMLEKASCHYYEFFEGYLKKIGKDIGVMPERESGLSHGLVNSEHYDNRIDTVNFALTHDDAMVTKSLHQAEVILVGVSRSGKTPTSLYLALHFGIKVGNYPLTEDDFGVDDLPKVLLENKDKLIGLTIDPKRLCEVREKRRPGSTYAALRTCQSEVRMAMALFKRYHVNVLDSSTRSIEELASQIVRVCGLTPHK